MARPERSQRWYSVSVETLRGWVILLSLSALAVVGYFGYRYWWQNYALKKEAIQVVDEARVLIQRVQAEKGQELYRGEYDTAWESFQQARGDLDREDYATAVENGRRSRNVLLSVLDSLRHQGTAGEAQFISVSGQVEFRRGEAGAWQDGRSRIVLRSGDYVRTGNNGSAEIIFLDGTLYNIRPSTQVIVSGGRRGQPGEQSVRMEYGWVNLNTAKSPSRVTTPEAEARVEQDSETFVAYERESKTARFGAYRGSLEVTSGEGERRQVNALEQVVQSDRGLSESIPLPIEPQLLEPSDNLEVNIDRSEEMVLRWQPVDRARTYALQISDSHLFVDNIIDVADRTQPRATLGIRGEGTFLWRVAALDGNGSRGPWSEPRKFRVASFAGRSDDDDREPPELELVEVTPYGNIFIVEGRTESGANVEINDEPVKVAADGSFTKTIQLTGEGWTSIQILARDAWGNESELSRQVFVESP